LLHCRTSCATSIATPSLRASRVAHSWSVARLARRELACLVVLACVLACSRPEPSPRPTTAFPTPFPTPSQNAAVRFGEEPSDVEETFRAEVEQITEDAQLLAAASCDRLAGAVREDPSLVSGLRAYAATLKSIAAQDQALDRPGTPYFLSMMEDALAELDHTLASCGIAI
jgi:hypothetical protein